MSANDYTPPDLATILRSLAASVPTAQASQPPFHRLAVTTNPPTQLYNYQLDGPNDLDPDSDLEEGEYDPSDALLPPAVLTPNTSATTRTGPAPLNAPIAPVASIAPTVPVAPVASIAPARPPPAPPAAPIPLAKPTVDPRTITTYPAALRHITQTVAQNEASMARIRKLIASQHQHERQWWEGRVQLIKQQAEREEGRKTVEDVLRSIGGKVPAPVARTTPAEDAAEVLRYDKKVHKACGEMINATMAELQAIGVPFFGLRRELVLQEGEKETGQEMDCGVRKENGRKKLREEEVLALQRRVVELLEDLCQE